MDNAQEDGGGGHGIIKSRKKLWIYVCVALGISVIALVLLSLLTMDKNTFKAISHIEVFSLVMVLVLVVGRWGLECLRYKLIIRGIDRHMSFGKSSKAILGAAFTGAITPYRSASFPVQVFFLNRYGLTGGEATAVSVTGGAISLLVMTLAMPVVLILGLSKMHVSLGMSTVIIAVAVIAFFAFIAAVYSIRDPSRVTKIVRFLTPRFIRKKPKYESFEEKFARGIADFSASLRRLLKARKRLLVAIFLLTAVFWLSGAFVASFLVRGFGFPQFFWKALLGQMLVTSILPFTPVPGESGVAEVAFAGIFSVFIAKNALALVTLAWRFFMLYVPLIGLGIFFILAANDARKLAPEHEPVPEIPAVEPVPEPATD
ncbi:MAG: lysylphosphatidylglycerol synthase transmembrane domain-containing protein [Candidatus Geothermincolia bacterium]